MYFHREIVETDGQIELCKSPNPFFFYISSCKDECLIGRIHYSDSDLGNVGWFIEPEFRGCNYAAKAFNLFKKVLQNNGIEEVTIWVHEDNIASIKTVEKIGGEFTQKIDFLPNVKEYKVDLKLEKDYDTSRKVK